jgi:hypothetical protein
MAEDIKNLFLLYANCLLKDKKEGFLNFLRVMQDFVDVIDDNIVDFKKNWIDAFEDLLQCKNIKDARLLLEQRTGEAMRHLYYFFMNKRMLQNYFFPDAEHAEIPDELSRLFDYHKFLRMLIYYAAYEAIYGYRNGYCENECCFSVKRNKIIDAKLFSGSNRIKCYECEQHFFVNILKGLIAGRENSEIYDSGC